MEARVKELEKSLSYLQRDYAEMQETVIRLVQTVNESAKLCQAVSNIVHSWPFIAVGPGVASATKFKATK